jgi:TolB-like protein
MKRCPECRRDYHDDTLSFCLNDGAELVYGLSPDEPQTALLHETAPASEASTRAQIHTTEKTAVLPGANAPLSKAGTFDKRVLMVPLSVALIALVAYIGYRYFSTRDSGTISSIAVLPFENRSGSADADYLSDGLTDSLIFRFSQLPDLKVSPTSSVMRYKGSNKEVSVIARELSVDGVLSGRLTQLGDNLSISVQLIDARTEKLVWAEQYDRKLADLLATHREIATTLTQKMRLGLKGDERGITKKYTNSNEAYQLYLKGRYHWARRGTEDLRKAIDSFEQAVVIDPTFALAYVGIAEAYNSIGKNPSAAPKDSVPKAKAAALRAIEMDDSLAEAHSALGDSLALYDWDWAGSEREFKKAIELDPNISYIRTAYAGTYLTGVGKADEAVSEMERAVELEPLSLIANAVLVGVYINAGQNEKGLIQAKKAYELDPTFPLAKFWLALAYIANGKYNDALWITETDATSIGDLARAVRALAFARAGRRKEAEAVVTELREASKTRYVRTYYFTWIYAALGENDKAFAELEKSFEDRDCYLGRATVDPFLDPLRSDPRFDDLMKRMKLA